MRLNKLVWTGLMALMLFMPTAAFADDSKSSNEVHAQVGKLAYFEGKFDQVGQGSFEVRFNAVRLEDGAQILSMKSTSTDGTYKFGAQFFDGADHEVTIQAINPANGAVLAENKMTVKVQAFSPPVSVQVKTMAFLLLIISIAMFAGVKLARLSKSKQKWKGGNPRAA